MTALGVVTVGSVSPAASAAASTPYAEQARELGKRAYDFGFPLLEFARVRRQQTSVRCPDGFGNAPVNSFSNAKRFATADQRTVVAPNTDTLYSIAHLNLKRGPITLAYPRMGRRYFSFELLDPYTNVIDIPGLREDGGRGGKVEVRWGKGPGTTDAPRPTRVIKSKYRRVWVIGRTLAKGPADQRKARKLMARYRLLQPNGKPRSFPHGCEPGAPGAYPTPSEGKTFIRSLNKQLEKSPPRRRDEPLLNELEPLGVGPGLSPGRAAISPDVRAALFEGASEEAASLPTQARIAAYQGALKTEGWLLPASNIGDYRTDYTFRAQIAVLGLGANTPDEAIYPAGIADRNGALYDGGNNYRLTFAAGAAPPAKYFWSLSVYDSNGYLVPNPAGIYALGPSHPPLVRKPDGSIVVAIQQTRPVEPKVNWLPSPPSGFRLNLRLYGPSKAARTGAWRPPGVVEVGL